MARSAADLQALKDELTNDPLDLGLTLLPADDEANANALNLVRDTITIDRESIPVSEIVTAVDADEYIGLSQPQRDYILLITNAQSVNPEAGNEVREALLQFFSAQSETRTKLTALLTEPANRIEKLFKLGTLEVGGTVTPSDIAQARQV